ncbi:MAG: hypothetical protein ACT4OH_08125 [Methylophilaceae bacterium]
MMLTPQDWRKLRYPILGLGTVMVIVGLLVSLAEQYYTKNQTVLQTQQSLLDQARQKFQSSGLEKETIMQYLPIYNDLLIMGFIGEERRIEWIEQLRQIHAQHKLFSIDYQIGLQEPYSPSFIPSMGNFSMQRSIMRLNLDMLHEGDLINLLDGLHEQTAPLIVRDCEIKRPIGAIVNTKNLTSNLKAACEIDWLTLRDPQLAGVL